MTTPSRPGITHAELMALPILRYGGPIHLVAGETDLRSAWNAIRRERVVGFDTETRPTFRRGQSYPPSLVQLATSKAVYLFQLASLTCSEVIADALGNAHLIKAGISVGHDLKQLGLSFPIQPVNMLELDAVAKRHGYPQTGVRNLAGIFLGGRITKSVQTSNWAQAHLTKTQQVYAATDAWICRELFLRFERQGLLSDN